MVSWVILRLELISEHQPVTWISWKHRSSWNER